MSIRVVSNGGGVQSTALLVLSALYLARTGETPTDAQIALRERFKDAPAPIRNGINFPIHLFCNVGDDSEHPATLEYVRNVAMPYAAANNIEFHELRRTRRDGSFAPTLLELSLDPNAKGVQIPMRMGRGGQPARRHCTVDYKIKVIEKWIKAHGATKANRAIAGIGISLDEFRRMRNDELDYQIREYPLIDMRLTRQDCMNIIERAGLRIPPKSSCFFCPFHNLNAWRAIKKETPDLFQKAADLEAFVINRQIKNGDYPMYMTDHKKPLAMAVGNGEQSSLDDLVDDNCESGYCMV